MFGIREEESAGKTVPVTVWPGPLCADRGAVTVGDAA